MSALRANLNVVCHQIRSPDNLGAVARLMVNFGFQRLTLSDPGTYAFREAAKMGVGAEPVLEKLQVAPGLGEALAESVYSVGTSSRARLKRRSTIAPEEGARRLAEASARGRVALVLGGEKRGMSDEDLSICQDVISVPTEESQPSMNLAQAAAVLLYLCAREDGRAAAPVVEESSPLSRGRERVRVRVGAPHSLLAEIEQSLGRALLASGFLNPQAPEHALRELLRSLARSGLSRREAEMWLSAARHLQRRCSS
ncbi:MAG: RNA methyltransferase [Myxococcales bacterium]|nr:RNA methyltransferase [Myxococcales bacterium]